MYDGYEAVGVGVGLAHLLRRVLQAHNARTELGRISFGNGEYFAVAAVEAYGNIAANFNVLPLILANGNYIALIKQYIRRHKHRICE